MARPAATGPGAAGRAGGEWSGYLAGQLRWFPHTNAPVDWHAGLSLAVEPEYYHVWDDGAQSLTFRPFLRLDQRDPSRTHADHVELELGRLLSAVERGDRPGGLVAGVLIGTVTEHYCAKNKGPVNEIVGTSCARVMSPLLQDRHFRTLAPVPFHRQVPSIDRPAGRSGIKVALFTGCLIDKMFPNIAHSTLKVLDHCGVGVYLPENQGCCGIPALSSGDLPTFQKLLGHSLERFERGQFDWLVTACATCTSTIHEVWPKMADGRHRDAATRLARRTMDINQYLIREAGLQPLTAPAGNPHIVTYHDPCHLKKSLKVFNEPRAVINATPGCTLKEMTEPDWCCGMGGSFNLQYYDISKGIGMKKAVQIRETGADVLTRGCPACMIQISDMLSQAGADVAVRHPVELYAEALEK